MLLPNLAGNNVTGAYYEVKGQDSLVHPYYWTNVSVAPKTAITETIPHYIDNERTTSVVTVYNIRTGMISVFNEIIRNIDK